MKYKLIGIITLVLMLFIPINVYANEEPYYTLKEENPLIISTDNLSVGDVVEIDYARTINDSQGHITLNDVYINESFQGRGISTVIINDNHLNYSDIELHFDTGNNTGFFGWPLIYNVKINGELIWKAEQDSDMDGIPDSEDLYPDDPTNTPSDTDGDGVIDVEDGYPNDPDKSDAMAPANISNLDYSVTDTTVDFTYDLPADDDFSHLIIERDGQVIADDYILNSYSDTGLSFETTYDYVFKSVDTSGNVSGGQFVSITTMPFNDTLPPETPTGLSVYEANGALSLSWNPNSEIDLAGYNVYVNGDKYNSNLVMNNSFIIYNLSNGNDYSIAVSAVDTSENESGLTSSVSGTPSSDKMPMFQLNTSLDEVALSTQNWFSELWIILAFAVAIPLSFIIARRVKTLFLG